jgi:hypothetical protein
VAEVDTVEVPDRDDGPRRGRSGHGRG